MRHEEMFRIEKASSTKLANLRQQYLQQLTFPRDGMWESFVDQADHYSVLNASTIVGYCVVNSDRKLLQFYVPGARDASDIFKQILNDLNIVGAFVTTVETEFLSQCMDCQKSVGVNALLYQLDDSRSEASVEFPKNARFRAIVSNELEFAVQFGVDSIAVDASWLRSYFQDRIEKQELFGVWLDNELLATGECRPSEKQEPNADVGMIVGKEHRGKGLATNVLRQLVRHCKGNGLRAICSTERENIAAQKAIVNAGFISYGRILEILF